MREVEIQKNEEKSICAKCGGCCCKSMSCHLHPDDVFKGNKPSLELLVVFLASGNYSIDWWEGDTNSTNQCYDMFFYLRPRHVGNVTLFDGSYGGKCIFLTPNGCSLDWEDRPLGGKALVPEANGRCHSEWTKFDSAKAWRKYHSWFDKIKPVRLKGDGTFDIVVRYEYKVFGKTIEYYVSKSGNDTISIRSR